MARQFNLKYINGDWDAAHAAAAGTTQATATLLTAQHAYVTTVGDGAGVRLKPHEPGTWCTYANADAEQDLMVYPPTGFSFNGNTANVGLMLPAGRGGLFMFVGPTQIIAVF